MKKPNLAPGRLPQLEPIAIVDVDDAARELPGGEVGEILLHGPQIMRSYFNDPAETANILVARVARETFGIERVVARDSGQIILARHDGEVIMVKYKDGEKKVIVTPQTAIVRMVPGAAADVKAGTKVIIFAATKSGDGGWTTQRVTYGKDGLAPPM